MYGLEDHYVIQLHHSEFIVIVAGTRSIILLFLYSITRFNKLCMVERSETTVRSTVCFLSHTLSFFTLRDYSLTFVIKNL